MIVGNFNGVKNAIIQGLQASKSNFGINYFSLCIYLCGLFTECLNVGVGVKLQKLTINFWKPSFLPTCVDVDCSISQSVIQWVCRVLNMLDWIHAKECLVLEKRICYNHKIESIQILPATFKFCVVRSVGTNESICIHDAFLGKCSRIGTVDFRIAMSVKLRSLSLSSLSVSMMLISLQWLSLVWSLGLLRSINNFSQTSSFSLEGNFLWPLLSDNGDFSSMSKLFDLSGSGSFWTDVLWIFSSLAFNFLLSQLHSSLLLKI